MLPTSEKKGPDNSALWTRPSTLIIIGLTLLLFYTISTHQDYGFVTQETVPTVVPTVVSTVAPTVTQGGASTMVDISKVWSAYNWETIAKEFEQIGLPSQTDKVAGHSYQWAYAKYLSIWKLQGKKLKMLEIGLGCGMGYGPGASYHLWHDYFGGNVDIYFLEFQCACAQQWEKAAPRPSLKKIYCGSQSDPDVLKGIIADAKASGEMFDFIVDDGGHTMEQQQVALEHLLHALKPGGLYFLEDLHTSYLPNWQNAGWSTTINAIKTFIDTLNARWGAPVEHEYSKLIVSLECMLEICVFTLQS